MRTTIFILLSITIFSCGDKLGGFEVPQPEGQKDEKGLPTKIIGQYINVKDSSTLSVDFGQITRSVVADFAEHKSELDSSDRVIFKNDTSFIQTDFNMRINVVVKGDTVFQHMDYKDTIFSVKQGDILRKFKGYYFLSHQTSLNNWNVIKLAKTKKGLTLGTISTKEDIEKLRELTGTKNDSIFSFRPTKKQLRRFLRDKGFSSEDTYIKIK
jgi:hypothetical protein